MFTSFRVFMTVYAVLATVLFCFADDPPVAPVNYDESKVPKYELPDPLKTLDGRTVDTPELWYSVRRPELLKLFEESMYGTLPLPVDDVPNAGYTLKIETLSPPDSKVFGGKGTRHQFRLHLSNEHVKENPIAIDVLIYTPNKTNGKAPAFLGLNLHGNHTVSTDSGVQLSTIWLNGDSRQSSAQYRGKQSLRFPIEMILDRGYAAISVYYGAIEPDFSEGYKHGVRQLLPPTENRENSGAFTTWAWGLRLVRSRLIEAQSELLNIDPAKVALIGHSRLGKTALWAGAMDTRFAMVISNDSGCGGAALSRREFGETVHRINTTFPHWFNAQFKKYNHEVNTLPFDQHELIALIAPRPVYIASASEDRWGDPRGEFLAALHADPVYRLLGTKGFGDVKEMPKTDRSVGEIIGYHIRSGKPDLTRYDWEQYLDFADKFLR